MFNSFVENQPNAAVPSQPSNPAVTQALPVYIPTPKHILEARKANGTNNDNGVNDNGAAGDSESPASKRPRLEYVPKAIKINHNLIPTYVPSALSRSTSVSSETNDLEYEPSNIVDQANQSGGDIAGLLTDLSSDKITKNGQTSGDNAENGSLSVTAAKETNVPTTNDDAKSKESRHRSSSSSSSRHHRHHSSSSSTSNHKSSHSDRKSGSSSSRSSSSSHRSSRHHHHSSSSRKSKHSDKEKDDDKVKLKTDGKSSSSESHHRSSKTPSSSSSRHRSSDHSNKKTHSNNNHSSSSNKPEEDCPNNSIVYDMNSEIDDDDDDDVEAQCRMIFEEFEPQTANDSQSDDMLSMELQATAAATNNHDSGIDDTTSTQQDDAAKRKRVAHENADKQVKPIATFKRNADHVKNAMQVIYERTNLISL